MSIEDYGRAREAVEELSLHGANREIAEQWLSCWNNGNPPRLGGFNRDKIWHHNPGINIFEIHEKKSVRCIKGAEFVKLAAGFDFTDQDILAITNAVDREALLEWMWQIVGGAVCVYYRSYGSKTEPSVFAQGVSLAFSDEKIDGARYFLTHTNWRPINDDWILGNVTIDLQIPAEKRIIPFKEAA